MPVPTVPYQHTVSMTTMLGAAEVYGWGYRGNGWPVPGKGESSEAYYARVLGGTWHPSSSDPITAGIEELGGAAIDLGLDVATPFAAMVGQAGAVQAAKGIVDAGLAADEKQALSHGTGPTVTYYPPPGLSLAQILQQISPAETIASALSKGKPMSSVRVTIPTATAAALGYQTVDGVLMTPSVVNALKTAAGIKAPPPTPANPSGGKTFLGIPVVDAFIGAAALAGIAIVAKVEGYL